MGNEQTHYNAVLKSITVTLNPEEPDGFSYGQKVL